MRKVFFQPLRLHDLAQKMTQNARGFFCDHAWRSTETAYSRKFGIRNREGARPAICMRICLPCAAQPWGQARQVLPLISLLVKELLWLVAEHPLLKSQKCALESSQKMAPGATSTSPPAVCPSILKGPSNLGFLKNQGHMGLCRYAFVRAFVLDFSDSL